MPPPEPPAPAPQSQPATTPSLTTSLRNGLTLSVSEAPPGDDAQLHLAFLVGGAFVAPGLAELAIAALVDGADASRGRPSLAQAIARLGGLVETSVGPLTSWVQIRVPAARWRDAQVALLRALDAPPLPRAQLERIRAEFVRDRVAALEADPVRALAESMLMAENDTASHIAALLDRDPSEVDLFRARLHRPERALFAVRVSGAPDATTRTIAAAERDSLAAWSPAPLAGPEAKLLPRGLQPGFYWCPDPTTETVDVAWLQVLPNLAGPEAPSLFALHACITQDGAGGRLERLQREQGLDQVRWRGEVVRGADAFAVLLRARVAAADVPRLQQLVQAARSSLRDVPPNESEFALARRRASLTAGLGLLDGITRQRVQATLALGGNSVEAFERGLAQLGGPKSFDIAAAARAYLDLPSMFLALGGTIPADLADVRSCALLPAGLGRSGGGDATPAPVDAAPWIMRASEAVGGVRLIRRLLGHRSEARLLGAGATDATETTTWRSDGSLVRSRQLLGKTITTTLAGTTWTEQLDTVKQSLTAPEAALLQREQRRHPLALLAACQRGDLGFAAVAQRTVGDRDYMVLQATGSQFDRLRIHVDTVSHLVRVVETWETLPDGTVVHLQDSWSDYRTTGGLRAPFRRVTTQDDGQSSVEANYSSWEPILAPL
ncbi:MAG: hypothetical protein JNL08_00440 [Planctomycetes bacterium]|nr:hypothetical protein [Planctomycetota bacterium]